MVIFGGHVPGRVVAIEDATLPLAAEFSPLLRGEDNNWEPFALRRSIVTRVGVSQQGNAQFQHTLGGSIYIYVFGDRIGQMTISGYAFADVCNPGAADGRETGVERMMAWYANNRLAVRRTEVEFVLGVTPLRGFLMGMQTDVERPDINLFSYTMQFVTVPENGNLDIELDSFSATIETDVSTGDADDEDQATLVLVPPSRDTEAPFIGKLTVGEVLNDNVFVSPGQAIGPDFSSPSQIGDGRFLSSG